MKRQYTTFACKRKYFSISVIQTVRDHTCLPQAGTSDIRLKLKIKGKDPTQKGMRTLQALIPYLK